MKQSEQRRIIDIISETLAGKNNITTRMKVVSRYIGFVNIIQSACELIDNTIKSSQDHSDHHHHHNLVHISF